jgi:hypothetical protein
MSMVSGTPDSGPPHPVWCARKHKADYPVHERKVGVDLELTGVAFGVVLQHVDYGDSPTQVLLMQATELETTSTRFTLLEAAILRDLLSEALGLVGRL